MIYQTYPDLVRFFFERRICLVVPGSDTENEELSEIEILKVKHFLSKYDVSCENKMQIYNSQELSRFIISELNRNTDILDYISLFILNIGANHHSLDDFLKTLLEKDPVKLRILSLLQEECPICYESSPTHCLSCTHILCGTCCEKVHRCPLCRIPFIMDNVKINQEPPLSEVNGEASSLEDKFSITSVKKLTKILILDESKFHTFCMERLNTILLKKDGVLTSIQTNTLFLLIKYFENDVVELFESIKICSEEVRCFIVAILYKIHSNTSLIRYINQPNRIIRFLSVLYTKKDEKYGKPNHHSDKVLLKGGRPFRSIILSMVNECEDSAKIHEEFIRHESLWKLIFKFTHFGEKRTISKFPMAFRYANSICNWKKILKERELNTLYTKWNCVKIVDKSSETPELKGSVHKNFLLHDVESTERMYSISGKVNRFIQRYDENIFDYLCDKPGLTFRILRVLSVRFESSNKLRPFLENIISKMTLDQIVDIYHVFSSSKVQDHPPVTVTSKATMHWGK